MALTANTLPCLLAKNPSWPHVATYLYSTLTKYIVLTKCTVHCDSAMDK